MGFWDWVKTGFAIYGFEEMKKDIKKRKAGDGSGNWRTEMDWINDSKSHIYRDGEDDTF